VSDITLHIGDVFDRLAKIPDRSIDLIVTSPPFLALRSYLPDDHPDKDLEIGSESGPAAFLDTMLALTAEWGRVLAPHGSLCVELGDTYSGSGGAGGDYNADGLRDGQQRFSGSAAKRAALGSGDNERPSRSGRGDDWPLSKSKTMLDTLYPACLAYGHNLLSGEVSPAGRWRIRNLIVWARPNPPVGALGDKFRPATSYITVACKSPRRWFDLDAVRSQHKSDPTKFSGTEKRNHAASGPRGDERFASDLDTKTMAGNPGGAPPLDWHADDHPEDGDWLWKMSPQGFAGSHYATFPLALPTRLIKAMCPERVCTVCGTPSERITDRSYIGAKSAKPYEPHVWASGIADGKGGHSNKAPDEGARVIAETVGWTDCGHNAWRTGRVLDPFAGSGTTLVAAHNESRDAIGIDLDDRNVAMVEDRLGPLVAACDLTVLT
jgi:site-specific DNA-methyltransferase (adenine-specific)